LSFGWQAIYLYIVGFKNKGFQKDNTMMSFFKFFVVILLIAIAVFMIICTEYGYECALPHGGYFKIKWDPENKKYDLFHWQPRKNIRPLPKNVIRLKGEKEEPQEQKKY